MVLSSLSLSSLLIFLICGLCGSPCMGLSGLLSVWHSLAVGVCVSPQWPIHRPVSSARERAAPLAVLGGRCSGLSGTKQGCTLSRPHSICCSPRRCSKIKEESRRLGMAYCHPGSCLSRKTGGGSSCSVTFVTVE